MHTYTLTSTLTPYGTPLRSFIDPRYAFSPLDPFVVILLCTFLSSNYGYRFPIADVNWLSCDSQVDEGMVRERRGGPATVFVIFPGLQVFM